MAVWGIASRIAKGRPVVTAVEVVGTKESPSARVAFEHTSADGEMALALFLLAKDLEQELGKGPPDAVVIRSMDWFMARRESVARPRLQVEGVLLATSRRLVKQVAALSGEDIGRVCGMKKADVAANAVRLMPEVDQDAAMAGLAALVLVERA